MSVVHIVSTRHTAEIERVYRERLNEFVSVANAVLHDEQGARDAVQDAFAAAIRRQSSFRAGDIEAWLWRIVVNSALSARRRQVRTREHEKHTEQAATASAPTGADTADIRDLLAQLSDRQRLAVFLRYYADLDYQAIATALAVRPGTVAATLHSAHAVLRRGLREVAT